MSDCIFCKIVNGTAPCMKLWEDEYTMAFMDIAKDVDGHLLVIPKAHKKNILDCDEETLAHIMKTVKRISNHLVENCGYNGVNLLNASDESAGQDVFHFHIHIIPRKNNDNIHAWPPFNGAEHDIEEIYKKISIKQD